MAFARGAGSEPVATQALSLPVFVLRGAFQTVATGPLASRPPTRKSPSPETTTAASARGARSLRSAASVHAVIFPVAASGVPTKTVSVGTPPASIPPRT